MQLQTAKAVLVLLVLRLELELQLHQMAKRLEMLTQLHLQVVVFFFSGGW